MLNAWFISDIHLKDRNERSSVILLRFLHSLLSKERPATHLFLLGDIFDVWVGDAFLYQNRYQEIVDALIALKRQGVAITYFEGNHDVHVKNFWKSVEIPVFVEPEYFQLGPWTVRLEHGDLMNPADEKYLKYRSFIRTKQMELVAHLVPAKLMDLAGRRSSEQSRKRHEAKPMDSSSLKKIIREYSEKAYAEKKFDYLIAGHVHFNDEYEIPKSKAKAINLGTWLEHPRALFLNEAGHSFISLADS